MSGRTLPADERPPSAVGLFTRGTFRALAAPADRAAHDWTQALAPVIAEAPGVTLAEAFNRGFELISRQYRPEYVFKNSIVDRLIFGRHSPRTAAAIPELHACASIVDIAVFNGTSTAYEIKTDLDDFSRLLTQLRCYEQCFERVVVVTSPRVASRVKSVVPDHVGVVALTDRGSLSEVRAPASGLARVSQAGLFGLLRRQEVLDILGAVLGYEVDVPPAQLWRRTRDLFVGLAVDIAHAQAVEQLRARGKRAAGPAGLMPRSLRAMAYEVPLNASEAGRAHARLTAPALSFVS